MYLVSACLIGEKCRYDGKDNLNIEIKKLVDEKKAIPVCPEKLGGMKVPRNPSEIQSEDKCLKVINNIGEDVTEFFIKGAEKTLEIAKENNINCAVLKSKSPSCGCGKIYNGSFNKTLINGNGITTDILIKNGIKVISNDDYLKNKK